MMVCDTTEADCMIGWQADQHRGVLKLQYPMRNGIIEDWDAMMSVMQSFLYLY